MTPSFYFNCDYIYSVVVGLLNEFTLFHFVRPVWKYLLHFWCHSFRAELPYSRGKKKSKLGPGSKQEHSWDMFKIGQTALHLKVDIYSSVDFRNYGKAR